MVMKNKYSASALAENLQVSVDSIRKKWPALGPAGVAFDRHEIHNGTTWPPFLEHFRDSARATEFTRSRAAELLGDQAPGPIPVPEKPETRKPAPVAPEVREKPVGGGESGTGARLPSWKKYANKKAKEKETERGARIPVGVIALVLLPALVWQMEHYATVVDRFSQIGHGATSYVFSWFFAFSVTGTAIVMTAAKGRLVYLYIFAGIETVANLLYYLPGTWIEWGTALLISGTMAFTILCYSEVFTKVFQDK